MEVTQLRREVSEGVLLSKKKEEGWVKERGEQEEVVRVLEKEKQVITETLNAERRR